MSSFSSAAEKYDDALTRKILGSTSQVRSEDSFIRSTTRHLQNITIIKYGRLVYTASKRERNLVRAESRGERLQSKLLVCRAFHSQQSARL